MNANYKRSLAIGLASFSFTASAGAAKSLKVSGIANPSSVGIATDVTVMALKANLSADTSYLGTIQFTSVPAGTTLPANYTFTAADAGVHTFTGGVIFSSASASASVTVTDGTLTASQSGIVVNKSTPVFSNLSAPTITYGVTSTVLGGTISQGSQFPSGNVTITVNSVAHPVAISPADGSFSFSLSTAGLAFGTYPITYAYAGDVNFNAITNNTKSLIFNKAPLTVTADNKTKVYDGLVYSGGYSATISGFVNGETSTVLGGTLSFSGTSHAAINFGTYVITPSGLTSSNYAITFSSGSLSITKAPLTITAATDTKAYDGNTSSTATPTVSGLKGTDTVTGLAEVFDTKNAGSNKTLSVSAFTVNDGNSGGNYTTGTVDNLTGVINKATLTITAVTDTKAYDGNTSSTATPTVSGLKGTDTVTGLAEVFDTKNAGSNKTLSVSAFTVNDGNSGGNYTTGTVDNLTGVVNKRAITVTAAANTKAFDGTTSSTGVPTVTAGSIVSGETGTFTQTFDTATAGTGKTLTPAGSVADGNSGNNYDITFVASTSGVITKANTTVVLISTGSPVEFGTAVTITATVSSAAGTPTGTLTFTVDGTTQTPVTLTNGSAAFTSSKLSVGDHTISAAYSGAANFNTSTSGNFTQKIIDTSAPVPSGLPTGNVTSGVVGQPVDFTWIVTDATVITFVWDFGDGTIITTTNTTTSHTFTAPGTYIVTVTATDAGGLTISSSLTFTVISDGTTTPPTDICDGLNPIAMHVKQVLAKVKFPSSLKLDMLTLRTVIDLPDGFSITGTTVQFQLAGIVGSATLDSKGNSPKSSTVIVSIKFNKPKQGALFTARQGRLTVMLKKQALTTLALTGITNLNATTTEKKGHVASTDVCMVLKGAQTIQAYHASAITGLYKGTKDKGGTFSTKLK